MPTVTEYWMLLREVLLTVPPWQGVLLTVALSLVVAKLVELGGKVAIPRLTRSIEGEVDDVIFRTIHAPLYVTVVLVGAYIATIPLGFGPETDAPLLAGTLSVITVLWAFTLTRLGRKVSKEVTAGREFDQTVVPIFQNVWTFLILGATIFLLLTVWAIDITPFLASAGIIGIVVGLAARDTIANFFGGIALYFDGTYAVGDYIVLESGERGRVEDISIRSTVIRTRDDMLVTVPNAVLNSARIVNESTPERERRIRLPVGVAYGSDVDHVEAVLLAEAKAEQLVLADPHPRVRFRNFGDSALDFELLCWIGDPVLRGRATHEMNKRIYQAFGRENIEIPFPQRVVTVADEPPAAPVATPDSVVGDGGE
ncbi:mechanosensitive ion channel family protein [Haladaptatus sp. YSMS36]|uniref:mechanosensitive ion channel family protein n=1 Tax=Haladaptatus sp. YSMS36 TaxID=3033384 RepID=UPI0023E8A219|nr:mechanosensitive ion channel family protein [Haladaptatus sp. YSMS36]